VMRRRRTEPDKKSLELDCLLHTVSHSHSSAGYHKGM